MVQTTGAGAWIVFVLLRCRINEAHEHGIAEVNAFGSLKISNHAIWTRLDALGLNVAFNQRAVGVVVVQERIDFVSKLAEAIKSHP